MSGSSPAAPPERSEHAPLPGDDAAGPFTGPLVVAIDFKQAQSYLALAPTRALARELGIGVEWRPLSVRPYAAPPEDPAADDRSTRHRRFRARYVEHDLRRYAESQGLVLRDLHRTPDTTVADTALVWVAGRARGGDPSTVDAYLDRVFAGHWSGELELESPTAIRGVLDTIGLDGAAFDPGAWRAVYQQQARALRDAGAFQTPAYLLGGEVFIGREHLPMIAWLLGGKSGPPPI